MLILQRLDQWLTVEVTAGKTGVQPPRRNKAIKIYCMGVDDN